MTSSRPAHAPVTLDQAPALEAAAGRLAREFDGVFGAETVNRFLRNSHEQLASQATVANFLPVLAEKFSRQRLRALARVDGLVVDGKPTVLFLCVHNAGRSQMALGFFQHYATDRGVAWSGGSEPGHQISPAAVKVMAEDGISIAGEFPKPWTDEVVQAADVVITMGCGDACPIFPGKRYEEWTLADPETTDLEGTRQIRDAIKARVLHLLDELGIPATP